MSSAALPDSVAIESGRIAVAKPDARGVRVFNGIPYAAPPVGERRWRDPAPVVPWDGIRPSNRDGPSCAQLEMFGPPWAPGSEGMSEDCLYLRIWTPAKRSNERLGVLVWIHGGAYVVSSASRFDGAALASHGVVVVAINYRLGALGFLSHPELTVESPHNTSGNYGLLDQIAALRWVQRNIAAFGGDPQRVAVGGHSAGATSTNILMASPLAKGLFTRALAQSGSAMSVSGPNDGSPLPRSVEEQKGLHFMRALGARNLAEMRAVSTDTLIAASGQQWDDWAWNASTDGYVLPGPAIDQFRNGRQSDVPLLVGWSANEGAAMGRATFGGDDQPFVEQVDRLFGASASEVLSLYPARTPDEERRSKTGLAGDGFIVYPSLTWVLGQRATGRQPVFVYKFAHPPPVPEDFGRDSMLGPPGAFHGSELAYVFGNLEHKDWRITAFDRRVSEQLQGYWARFIAHGDPNGDGAPAWPAYQPETPWLLRIDSAGIRAAPDTDRARLDALGQLARRHPGSLSYRGMDAERWLRKPPGQEP